MSSSSSFGSFESQFPTTPMAHADVRDLQLAFLPAGRNIAATDESGDLEHALLLDSRDGADHERRRVQVRISGMTCTACSNSIESALKAVDGVLSASVALLQNKADVVFNPALLKVLFKSKLYHFFITCIRKMLTC